MVSALPPQRALFLAVVFAWQQFPERRLVGAGRRHGFRTAAEGCWHDAFQRGAVSPRHVACTPHVVLGVGYWWLVAVVVVVLVVLAVLVVLVLVVLAAVRCGTCRTNSAAESTLSCARLRSRSFSSANRS
jgi:hypothetical protein